MTAPTLEQPARDEEPSSPGLDKRMLQLTLRVTPPITAVLMGILLMTLMGTLLIMFAASGFSLADRFGVSVGAYGLLVSGSFGNVSYFASTLDKLGPLVLAAFSVAVAYRGGLFNIGTAGQIAVGGMLTLILGIRFGSAPGVILGPVVFLAGVLGGAIWGGIVGLLKAWRGAHEVVTTIMLNFVAFWLSVYLVNCTGNCIPGVGSIHDPTQNNVSLPAGPGATLPSFAHIINLMHPGTIAHESDYQVTIGLLIALAGGVVYWFLMQRTTLGYEIRAVGQSQKAARYAGINVKRNIILTMVIAGAFGGAAGAILVMGPDLEQTVNNQTFSSLTIGFDAISVALLGFNGPIGIILAGLLFAALNVGAISMEADSSLVTNFQVRHEFIQFAFQAIVLFLIAGQIVPQFRMACVRLLTRLVTGFRSSLRRLPSVILAVLTIADGVAITTFLGFTVTSAISLTPFISGAESLHDLDMSAPYVLLLLFYITGLVIILLLLGIQVSRKALEKGGTPPLLVEASPATALLAVTAPHQLPQRGPEIPGDDSSNSTV
jgi:simple sugar transport system permease protein